MKSFPVLIILFGLLALIVFTGTGCSRISPAPLPESGYQWNKLADTSPWSKSYNFQMMAIRDTLWVFHQEGNWWSADGQHWTKSSLPNAIGNLAFLDYLYFENKIFGLGHLEGNVERYNLRPTIYFSSDRMHWDSIEDTNLPKRYFYHPFVWDDKIWIIGGEQDNDIWADVVNSPDGIHWTIMKDKLPFGPVENSRFLLYKDKIWMFNEDVWSSSDGYQWTQVSPAIVAGQKIFGYAAVVYDDKMWLIGYNRVGQFDSQVLFSDDGIHWNQQTAPWTKRGGVAAEAFQGKIIMTGGKSGGTPQHPEFVYNNDLWEMTTTAHPTN